MPDPVTLNDRIEAAAKAGWNLHANVPWDVYFERRPEQRAWYIDQARAMIAAADALLAASSTAQKVSSKLIQGHLGVEITPPEVLEVQGRLPDLVRERLRDAADQLADGLLAGDEPDIYELREHLREHVPKRGLRISIHVHDPLTNPEGA